MDKASDNQGSVSVWVGTKKSPVAYNSVEVGCSVKVPVEDIDDPNKYTASLLYAEELAMEEYVRVEKRMLIRLAEELGE